MPFIAFDCHHMHSAPSIYNALCGMYKLINGHGLAQLEGSEWRLNFLRTIASAEMELTYNITVYRKKQSKYYI